MAHKDAQAVLDSLVVFCPQCEPCGHAGSANDENDEVCGWCGGLGMVTENRKIAWLLNTVEPDD